MENFHSSKNSSNVDDGGAFSLIPPYMLKEMLKQDPGNKSLLDTYIQTRDLMAQPNAFKPRATDSGDFHGLREVYDAKQSRAQPGDRARFEGDPVSSDDAVNKAYDYTGIVRDFYEKEFGRNSIDGKGMKMISTVNFGVNYQNAFWNGSQMTYGHVTERSPFKTFMLLDVAGHEITHGVTQVDSGMEYYNQSGALNESMSDVFGEVIQQYSKHQTANEADWIIGEGIWKDSINGQGLRNMLHPGTAYDDPQIGRDPQPDHMRNFVKKSMDDDNGGVHFNSGIPNRAFALFARAVGGYAWEDPAHIWYEARKEAGSTPTFAQFAWHTIEAAKKLGHENEVAKLSKAWEDVGVTPAP